MNLTVITKGAGQNPRPAIKLLIALSVILGAVACHKKSQTPPEEPTEALSPIEQGTPPSNPAVPPVRRPVERKKNFTPEQVAKGKALYQANCTSCHNADPRKPGSVGPDVYDSPHDLLESRLIRNAYPPMYRPKRSTHLMPTFPQLAQDIDAIEAYLNSPMQ
jgi:mono/diheme cytochrome c family protein